MDVRVRLPEALRADVAPDRRPAARRCRAPAGTSLVPLGRPRALHAGHLAVGDQPPRPLAPGDRRRQPRRPAARHGGQPGARGRQRDRPARPATRMRGRRRHRDHGRVVRLHGRGAAARRHLRLPDPRRAVRVVRRPALDHAVAAAVDRRHGRHAGPDRRHDQHHVAHRPDHADGARHQERHPARRLHQGAARHGRRPAHGAHHRRPHPAAADHDDDGRDDLRHAAARPRPRRRRRDARADGPRGHRRPDHVHAAHAHRRAGRLHAPRRRRGVARPEAAEAGPRGGDRHAGAGPRGRRRRASPAATRCAPGCRCS